MLTLQKISRKSFYTAELLEGISEKSTRNLRVASCRHFFAQQLLFHDRWREIGKLFVRDDSSRISLDQSLCDLIPDQFGRRFAT